MNENEWPEDYFDSLVPGDIVYIRYGDDFKPAVFVAMSGVHIANYAIVLFEKENGHSHIPLSRLYREFEADRFPEPRSNKPSTSEPPF